MESEVPRPPDPDPAPVPEPLLCAACGTTPREGANYCPGCGEPLRAGLSRAPRRLTARQILSDVRRSPRPIRQTLVFYGLWLGCGLIGAVAAHLETHKVHLLVALDALTLTLTAGWALACRRDAFRLYAFSRSKAAWLAIPLVAAWPIAAVISAFAGWLQDLTGLEHKYTTLFFDHGFGWSWVILVICVQPAVVEELAFRGIIQTSLFEVMKPGEALVVSAVAFAIMHWNLVMLVPLFVLGLYMGWLRQRSASLWPAMVAHFAHNLLVTLDEGWDLLPG